MLLKIVALARDIADDLETIGQAHLGDLAKRRIRLLRRRRVDARADAALLRRGLQGRNRVAVGRLYPTLADQLVDRRHTLKAFILTVRSKTLVACPSPNTRSHAQKENAPSASALRNGASRFRGPRGSGREARLRGHDFQTDFRAVSGSV